MDDLIAFVTARLEERAATANELHRARDCGSISRSDGDFSPDPIWCSCGYPARVLREVEAMRAILRLCAKVISDDEGHEYYSDGWAGLTVARHALRHLAAVWKDHPDYRPERGPVTAAS